VTYWMAFVWTWSTVWHSVVCYAHRECLRPQVDIQRSRNRETSRTVICWAVIIIFQKEVVLLFSELVD
jgi:hypothetical protein